MNIVMRNSLPLSAGLRRAALDDSFERLMHSIFDGQRAAPPNQVVRTIAPSMNVNETELAYEVEAELPGVRKEDVKISIDAGRVSIEAETAQKLEQKEGQKLLVSERSFRKYARSFVLPEEVNEAAIDARLEDGILYLSMPKKPAVQAKQITVR